VTGRGLAPAEPGVPVSCAWGVEAGVAAGAPPPEEGDVAAPVPARAAVSAPPDEGEPDAAAPEPEAGGPAVGWGAVPEEEPDAAGGDVVDAVGGGCVVGVPTDGVPPDAGATVVVVVVVVVVVGDGAGLSVDEPVVLGGAFGTVVVVVVDPGAGAGASEPDVALPEPDVALPEPEGAGAELGAGAGPLAGAPARVKACPLSSTVAHDPVALHDTALRWPRRSMRVGFDHVAPSYVTSFPKPSTAVQDAAPGQETAVSWPRASTRAADDQLVPL